MILTKILEENAQKFAKKPAFTMRMGYRTKTFTYKDVYDVSRRVALFLQKNGIQKGDKVLIFAPNSPYWGCIFWGIILQGAIAVPVNVQSTTQMIQKIADQTESKIIFKSRFLKRDLPSNLKSYDIEFLDELIQEFNPQDFKQSDINENDLIEILYTSGTTGDPKGVLLTHKNIALNLESIRKIIKLKKGKDRLLSILPLTHIFEQTIGFFLAQSYAAHVIYAHSYAAILDLMQEYKITKMLAVPEFLKVLMSRIKAVFEKKGLLKVFEKLLKISLKIKSKTFSRILFYPILRKFGGKIDTIASGGAFLDPELEKDWNALGVTLLQGFGLTETSPTVTSNTFMQHKMGSVGKIIQGVQVKIADDGEILVKGPNVFSGYFKNEEKTKESFTPDGWFKTGDMGQFDEDGFLFLKGRKKYVILGPGAQNVFPEDIEFELNKIEGVKDSCVVGLEKNGGMVEIHSVLLLEPDAQNPGGTIKKANSNLASYQQITGYSVWPEEDFPRSATRKVKKEEVLKFLKEKKEQFPVKKDGRTPLIKMLSQLTGVDIAKIHEDTKVVSDLNMDSLMRVELTVRIEQDFGIFIDESQLKPETTVAQLQEMIEKKEEMPKPSKLKKWPRSWWARIIRVGGQYLVLLFYRIFIRLKIEGSQNLKDIKFPVIFMPNHISYIDPAPILLGLPRKIKRRLVFSAAKDVLYQEYGRVAWLAELLFNSFVLPRLEGENIRLGLDYMGRLLDQGYSVIFFPEGHVSVDGKMQPLKQGAGFIAVEMDVPVVLVKIIGTDQIVPYAKAFPRKIAQVIIKFGKPIKFNRSDDYKSVQDRLEKELKEL